MRVGLLRRRDEQGSVTADGMAPAGPARLVVLDSLTSLRFVAALLVFLVHAALLLPDLPVSGRIFFAGPTGVGFFFILSGFVLAWSSHRTEQPGQFYRRRFARIYPTHLLIWAAWLATFLVIGLAIPKRPSVAVLLLVQSWVPHREYFDGIDTPSWSLACEAFFYLLFPVVVVTARRLALSSRRVLMGLCCVVPVALGGLNPLVARHLPAGSTFFFVYNFPPARLAEFLVGVLLALEVRAGSWPRIPVPVAAASAVAALAVVDVLRDPRWWVAVPVVPFTVLIGSLALSDQDGRRTVLRRRSFVRLGQWSYAFYLVHSLVLVALIHAHPHPFAPLESLLALLGALVASVALSGLIFLGWERPCERWLRPGHGVAAALQPPRATLEPLVAVPQPTAGNL